MGKTIINTIGCVKCHKEFDVATEDIKQEHLNDAGEVEEGNTIHDFNVFQTVRCPYCHKENKIVLHAKGKSESELTSMRVISLEIE